MYDIDSYDTKSKVIIYTSQFNILFVLINIMNNININKMINIFNILKHWKIFFKIYRICCFHENISKIKQTKIFLYIFLVILTIMVRSSRLITKVVELSQSNRSKLFLLW